MTNPIARALILAAAAAAMMILAACVVGTLYVGVQMAAASRW